METPGPELRPEAREGSLFYGVLAGILLLPIVAVGACFVVPYILVHRWLRGRREAAFKRRMRAQGRLMAWTEFRRAMRNGGGTCIEEKFSAKGPVRLWWTPEVVEKESPHAIIDWFTMRKGRQHEPFVHWCRARYTSADGGSAVLVDASLAPKREIYTLWSECRSDAARARWIEVAPPEILPRRPER